MVGTSAFTKLAKVDINGKTEDSKECPNTDVPENVGLLEDGSNIAVSGPNRSPNGSRRGKTGHRNAFSNFYLLALFILFTMSSLILACALKKLVLASEFLEKKTSVYVYDGSQKKMTWPDPPPHEDLAAVARYVVHISEWGSLSTNSIHPGIEGYPFVNVFSMSDGPVGNSSGVPYFYLTPMELSVKDLKVNNKVSFTVSEAQSDYCNKKGFDPEDPRCAHIILTGSMQQLEKDSPEENFARDALFSRHEEMQEWPDDHHFFFAKIEIIHIYVLDFFGGAGVVTPEKYFATNPFA